MLRDRLMQPNAVAEFISAYTQEVNGSRSGEQAERTRLLTERTATARKLEGLYDAIAEGLRTPGLKERLETLEARLAELDQALAAPAPTPVRFHPNLAEAYRKKVAELAVALTDPAIRTEALEIIRGLITRVTVTAGEDGVTLGLDGALSALIGLGSNAKNLPLGGCSVEVVAGAGFEPAAFRL